MASDIGCNYNIPTNQCTLQTCSIECRGAFTYRPSLGGNLFFAIFFAVFILPQIGLGIRYKTWGYMIGMVIGLVLEVIGYASRVWLYYDPFSNNAFLIYLILLTIAPVFMSASVYLTITRVIHLYGPHLIPIPAKLVAVTFMTSDFLSLVLQAAGGAIAETADNSNDDPNDVDISQSNTGKDIMIAGLFLQAVSLALFAGIWALYMLRVRTGVSDQDPGKVAVRTRKYYVISQISLILATAAILARSIFRVVELWGGFKGKIWNDEVDFLVLDGAMIGLATVLLTCLHPGPAFKEQWFVAKWKPQFWKSGKSKKGLSAPSSDEDDVER